MHCLLAVLHNFHGPKMLVILRAVEPRNCYSAARTVAGALKRRHNCLIHIISLPADHDSISDHLKSGVPEAEMTDWITSHLVPLLTEGVAKVEWRVESPNWHLRPPSVESLHNVLPDS